MNISFFLADTRGNYDYLDSNITRIGYCSKRKDIVKPPVYYDSCESNLWREFFHNVLGRLPTLMSSRVERNICKLKHIRTRYHPAVIRCRKRRIINTKKYWPVGTIPPPPPLQSKSLYLPPLHSCKPIYDMVKELGADNSLTSIKELYQKLDLDSNLEDRVEKKIVSLVWVVNELSKLDNKSVYKIGSRVFYMVKSNTVIKFLSTVNRAEEFLREIYFGLILRDIKGVVPIEHIYPEVFCYEMPFLGLSMNHVLFEQKIPILQHVVNRYRHTNIQTLVYDYTLRFVKQLPYVIAEMANIFIRLSNQGIVYLDIKPDNFVIDIYTGQPYLIDMELVTFAGTTYSDDPFGIDEIYRSRYPQSPPELLDAKLCDARSMTYGFACHLDSILRSLEAKRYDTRFLLKNSAYRKWIAEARCRDINVRPHIGDFTYVLKQCFPHIYFETSLTLY